MSAVPRKPVMVTIPAISLLHVSETTRQEYLVSQYGDVADGLPFMVAPHDNGYFLTVPACQACEDDEQREQFATIPVDLRAVFDYMATYSHFGWMLLDVDGDIIPGLPLGDDHTERGPVLNCYDCQACGHTWDATGEAGIVATCPECCAAHVYPVSSNEI